ncbi:hypothetical protein [Myxosarcina sp. GI1]|uniref:hypothetical protein n=1 Tax=Myxosarcina sp. GI1 TaxID=1541065 RepID=UPI000569781C|nr:hypothetical protein [Myxosarcina sp. GI1]
MSEPQQTEPKLSLLSTARYLNREYATLFAKARENFEQTSNIELRKPVFNKEMSNSPNIFVPEQESNMYSAFKDLIATLDDKVEGVENVDSLSEEKSANEQQNELEYLNNAVEKNIEPKITTEDLVVDRQQNTLVEIALNLTEPAREVLQDTELNVSQIGDYQLWRDRDDIALIDVKNNELIVYSQTNVNIFPETANSERLQELTGNSNSLWQKIKTEHPTLDTNYRAEAISSAASKFQPLDPTTKTRSQLESQQVPSLSSSERRSLEQTLSLVKEQVNKIQERYSQTKNWLGKISESISQNVERDRHKAKTWFDTQTQKIAAYVTTKRLIEHAYHKYQTGERRLGDNKYSVGDYNIERTKSGEYQIRDRQNKTIAAFKELEGSILSKNRLTCTAYNSNLDELQGAMKAFKDPSLTAKGTQKQENTYELQLNQIIKQVANNDREISQIGMSKYSIELHSDRLIVKKDNKNIIEANATGTFSQIGISEIDEIKRELNKEKQQKRVDTIAPILSNYLNLNQTHKVDKASVLVEYLSDTKTIIFRDKNNPEESLEATWSNGRWNDSGNTKISEDKEIYFVSEVAPKVNKALSEQQQIQNHSQQKSQRRGIR